ncbi:MAG: PepSY domain-containing protein [Ruminococcus sp.]|jgi:uncharacterized membrane protein YkoI|nr:PepSY domain-containing protein [Ruminococcus sp.]
MKLTKSLKWIIVTALIVAAAVMTGIFATADDEFIGTAKAKDIALTDAGLKEEEVKFARSKLEFDDGIYEYDVEFFKGKTEYDYSIEAYTGEIIEKDADAEFIKKKSEPARTVKYEITADEAKAIAFTHAGVKETDVNLVRAKLTFDDGVYEYEVEFYKDNIEYDYDIDSMTGEILSYDMDADYYRNDKPSATAVKPAATTAKTAATAADKITSEKAEAIALEHAGLTVKDVKYIQAEYDRDDGKFVYEVEFRKDRTEYSYTIDAVTGKILEFEKEIDD